MRRRKKIEIDEEKLHLASENLRALAHPLRIKILEFIDQNEGISFSEIHSTLKLDESITSQHIRILSFSGMIETRRNGKFITYKVNYQKIAKCTRAIDAFLFEEQL